MFGGRLGWTELLLILIIMLVFFGPKKLPQLGRSIGEGIREFKKGTQGIADGESGSGQQESAKNG